MSSVWQRHGIGLEFKNERGNGDFDVAADRARHLLQSTSDIGAGVPQATQSRPPVTMLDNADEHG